jgi:AcrR family transcriptional regulator
VHGEHDQTKRDLIRAARDEFAAVGQAAFTMDGVAKRAFYSPGSLYGRWSDRIELLADLGCEVIRPDLVRDLDHIQDRDEAIAWVLDEGRPAMVLAGELLIAGHTNSALHDVAVDIWGALRGGLQRLLPPGMAWYVATIAIGGAMLDVIDLPGPTPPTGRVTWLSEACNIEEEARHTPRRASEAPEVDVPVVPPPIRSDPTAQALIQAAKSLLAEHGSEGISTRRVSAAAGVTTGAIYRRYDGRAALLSDVLLAELAPDRYEWTWELVRALASDDPYWSAADVMTRRLIATMQDEASQRVLLHIGVAARNDDALRAQVRERVLVAHRARTDMFMHLRNAGVTRDDVDPAVFAWGFQTLTVGLRVTQPLGIPIDVDAATIAMRAVMTGAAAR